ncbi:MAG: folate-binding protein YgfZ [Burkholderiaceae bacterium]|nr:folate-binding protein YgfZ [Burkholderiaceae bacterium]
MTELSNDWQEFVSRQEIAPGPVTMEAGFFAALPEFGIIAVSGEDAAAFLHSQLTNDVETLDVSQARLAGYCTAKGRLLATMLIWRSTDQIFLMLPRELLAPIQKRLQMFVLRAKVKLRDASADYAVLGLAGSFAAPAIAAHLPESGLAPYAKRDSESGSLIRLPDAGGVPRSLWIAEPAQAITACPVLAGTLKPASSAAWRLSEIEAGIPWVVQATQEKFVPQMINLELIGGVNFKKGCYPGQEIVARSQYLGKLKRRMLPARLLAPEVAAGMEVFAESDPDQPCGMIVNAEHRGEGEFACLVEIKLAEAAGAAIHLGSADGPALRFSTLPYALPD